MIWDVIIIGSGPSGLGAAFELKDKKVLLIEKENVLGKKMRLSGAGQCNITHGGAIDDFSTCYGDKWRFIRHAMLAFDNSTLRHWLKKMNIETIVREDGKVFPSSLDANQVVDTIVQNLSCEINKNETVIDLTFDEVWSVKTNKSCYQAQKVIVATGGHGYPKTGSTGDAVPFAKSLGISYEPYRYALSPVYLEAYELSDLMGLSFNQVSVDHYRGKKVGTYVGDLLFTHFGFSGPVIINASRHMIKGDELLINFTNLTRETYEKELMSLMSQHPKKKIKHMINGVPSRFVQFLMDKYQLNDTFCSELKKEARKQLIKDITSYRVVINQVGKSHIAMVSAGGILTKALNKKTFESKKSGLYFVGECVDVDGDTGGYNIQYAFSSGIAAAKHISEVLSEKM